jgi:hypothetical protein
VLYFNELQYRFLDAVAGQTTPYLRFRFTAPTASCYTCNDTISLVISSSNGQPYKPKTSTTNIVVQFLPALSSDRDFSVGVSADATLIWSGSWLYYAIYMRGGGLVANVDYLLQIS